MLENRKKNICIKRNLVRVGASKRICHTVASGLQNPLSSLQALTLFLIIVKVKTYFIKIKVENTK